MFFFSLSLSPKCLSIKKRKSPPKETFFPSHRQTQYRPRRLSEVIFWYWDKSNDHLVSRTVKKDYINKKRLWSLSTLPPFFSSSWIFRKHKKYDEVHWERTGGRWRRRKSTNSLMCARSLFRVFFEMKYKNEKKYWKEKKYRKTTNTQSENCLNSIFDGWHNVQKKLPLFADFT